MQTFEAHQVTHCPSKSASKSDDEDPSVTSAPISQHSSPPCWAVMDHWDPIKKIERENECLCHENCPHCHAIQQLTSNRDDLYRSTMRREVMELHHTACLQSLNHSEKQNKRWSHSWQARLTPIEQELNPTQVPFPKSQLCTLQKAETTCSPCCATYKLQKHVCDHRKREVDVHGSVEKSFYVDNCVQSSSSEEEVKALVVNLCNLLAIGGYYSSGLAKPINHGQPNSDDSTICSHSHFHVILRALPH